MQPLTRRQLLQWAGFSAAALVFPASRSAAQPRTERREVRGVRGEEQLRSTYPFELPELPYAADALEPHIDARTMEIHHGRHHQAYVDNLNAALKDHTELHNKTLEELIRGLNELPEEVRTAVRNNGGGHLNHTIFWHMMTKDGEGEPRGDLARAIESTFGGFEQFQGIFTQAALGRFGSGWAWLVVNRDHLEVMSTPNQDSPLTEGAIPILGIDVWEHAYYLKYQNRRADYVKEWWNVVNWFDAAERYAAARR